MNEEQLKRMREDKGFVAALDQSGGSTPKALAAYGIEKDAYDNDEEMFSLVHDMRTRIITSPAFDAQHILGAILFEQTMDNKVGGKYTADYLTEDKGIVPFLKVDKGLADEVDGSQLMKAIPDLDDLLERAKQRNIFGTKMRSVIKGFNEKAIKDVVQQQFDIGKQIIEAGLVPIIEPEVDIHSTEKEEIEAFLKDDILYHLDQLADDELVMLKLTIPTEVNLYKPLIDHPNVVRFVALSGGYETNEANEKLAKNEGMLASFSRALTQDLRVDQTDETFNQTLKNAVESIYKASIT